tara:strand:- start:1742 stop:2071 length:330 start_codon:yes stop_codon:yes gene_type:complete
MLENDIKTKIKEHSIDEHPNECCGLVLSDGKREWIHKCKNIAKDKKNNFDICPIDYIEATKIGKIKAYYHSHPDNNYELSDMDKKVSLFNELKLIMYCVGKDRFLEHNE